MTANLGLQGVAGRRDRGRGEKDSRNEVIAREELNWVLLLPFHGALSRQQVYITHPYRGTM